MVHINQTKFDLLQHAALLWIHKCKCKCHLQLCSNMQVSLALNHCSTVRRNNNMLGTVFLKPFASDFEINFRPHFIHPLHMIMMHANTSFNRSQQIMSKWYLHMSSGQIHSNIKCESQFIHPCNILTINSTHAFAKPETHSYAMQFSGMCHVKADDQHVILIW